MIFSYRRIAYWGYDLGKREFSSIARKSYITLTRSPFHLIISLTFELNTAPVRALGYRTEMDGLRVLAVVALVSFHAQLKCPGGYAGMDVIFVIYGYFTTSLLLRDLRGEATH